MNLSILPLYMRNIIFIVFQSYRVPFAFAARNLVTRCQIFTYIFRTLSRSLLMYSNVFQHPLEPQYLSSDSCRSCRTIILIIEKIDNNKSEIDSHFLKSYPPYSFSIASTPLSSNCKANRLLSTTSRQIIEFIRNESTG